MEKVIKHTIFTTKDLCKLIKEKGINLVDFDDETITLLGWGFEICLNIDGTFWISDTAGG